MGRLTDWYRGLPRAARWLVLTAIAVVLTYAVIVPAREQTARLNERAAELEAAMRSERSLAAMDLSGYARAYGTPEAIVDSRVELDRRVAEVLSSHGVTERRIEGAPSPLRSDQAQRLVETGQRLERLVLTVSFEATPQIATAVIADLERSPEVAALDRVELRGVDGTDGSGVGYRTVRATIGVETWLRSKGVAQ